MLILPVGMRSRDKKTTVQYAKALLAVQGSGFGKASMYSVYIHPRRSFNTLLPDGIASKLSPAVVGGFYVYVVLQILDIRCIDL